MVHNELLFSITGRSLFGLALISAHGDRAQMVPHLLDVSLLHSNNKSTLCFGTCHVDKVSGVRLLLFSKQCT